MVYSGETHQGNDIGETHQGNDTGETRQGNDIGFCRTTALKKDNKKDANFYG